MTNFSLEPLNEGQEMNARVWHKGTVKSAVNTAATMVTHLHTALPGCSITVRVRRESKSVNHYTDEAWGRIVMPSGLVLNELTGDPV
jgi:hypothetical protein